MWNKLEDLDFADDLALLSHGHQQIQEKTTKLLCVSAQFGLKINRGKIKILKVNATSQEPVMLEGEALEEVDSFTYLGSVVDKQGGTEADVKISIHPA